MERASNVKTVPVSMGWSDVGGFRALHELLTEEATGNYTNGPVHVQNSSGLYVRSEGPSVSVNGTSDLIFVATPHEVMITPMESESAVKELGEEIQANRYTLGVSPSVRRRAREWLWTAFDLWSRKCWDETNGGFVEQLNLVGEPDLQADRRLRVQARQVFSFAKAVELGWPQKEVAKELVESGIEFINERLRHPDGGWIHRADSQGNAVDDNRDLYDHAFIILAGSAAHMAIGSPKGLRIADEAMAFIETELRDQPNRGWFESASRSLPRRANPHMHLLEASIEHYGATGSTESLNIAREIVGLFEARFFNPRNDVMSEFFGAEWQLESDEDKAIMEPGHHYEWATLLLKFELISGHDTRSWRRRLMHKANRIGWNKKSGFLANMVRADGTLINSQSRLWHQLEMLRACLLHPDSSTRSEVDHLFERIMATYLSYGPEGTWLDELNENGEPASSAIPASMLYHAVSSLCLFV